MPVFHVAQFMGISTRLLEAAGVPPGTAVQVAASLIEGNLTGHDSHGVIRLTQYVRGIGRGQIRTAEPSRCSGRLPRPR